MKTIIANWKANPTTLEEAQELFDFSVAEASKYPNIKTIICPPPEFIEELAKQMANGKWPASLKLQRGEQIANVSVGAQDILEDVEVTHVLVGHSDRRYKIGETDEMINKKIKAALEADIVPVLLVGERNHGDDRKAVLEQQLAADLAGLTAEQISKILITYEPVWAISTQPNAQPDTPQNTLAALKIIDNFVTTNYKLQTINYLYGGSVNSKNAADFLSHPEISGAVIGGASLRKEEFSEILRVISEFHD